MGVKWGIPWPPALGPPRRTARGSSSQECRARASPLVTAPHTFRSCTSTLQIAGWGSEGGQSGFSHRAHQTQARRVLRGMLEWVRLVQLVPLSAPPVDLSFFSRMYSSPAHTSIFMSWCGPRTLNLDGRVTGEFMAICTRAAPVQIRELGHPELGWGFRAHHCA